MSHNHHFFLSIKTFLKVSLVASSILILKNVSFKILFQRDSTILLNEAYKMQWLLIVTFAAKHCNPYTILWNYPKSHLRMKTTSSFLPNKKCAVSHTNLWCMNRSFNGNIIDYFWIHAIGMSHFLRSVWLTWIHPFNDVIFNMSFQL